MRSTRKACVGALCARTYCIIVFGRTTGFKKLWSKSVSDLQIFCMDAVQQISLNLYTASPGAKQHSDFQNKVKIDVFYSKCMACHESSKTE